MIKRDTLLTSAGILLGLSTLACGDWSGVEPSPDVGGRVGVDEEAGTFDAPEEILLAPSSSYTLTFEDDLEVTSAQPQGNFSATVQSPTEVVIETADAERANLLLELELLGAETRDLTISVDVRTPDQVELAAPGELLLLHDDFTVPVDLFAGGDLLGGVGYMPFQEVEGVTMTTERGPTPASLTENALEIGKTRRVLNVSVAEEVDSFTLTPAFDGRGTYQVARVDATALDRISWSRHNIFGDEEEPAPGPIEGEQLTLEDLGFGLVSLQSFAGEGGVLDANFHIESLEPEKCDLVLDLNEDPVLEADVATGQPFLIADVREDMNTEATCEIGVHVVEQPELTSSLTVTLPNYATQQDEEPAEQE